MFEERLAVDWGWSLGREFLGGSMKRLGNSV
jgi:hypothetical protein